jgi:hypothetical protein
MKYQEIAVMGHFFVGEPGFTKSIFDTFNHPSGYFRPNLVDSFIKI